MKPRDVRRARDRAIRELELCLRCTRSIFELAKRFECRVLDAPLGERARDPQIRAAVKPTRRELFGGRVRRDGFLVAAKQHEREALLIASMREVRVDLRGLAKLRERSFELAARSERLAFFDERRRAPERDAVALKRKANATRNFLDLVELHRRPVLERRDDPIPRLAATCKRRPTL